MPFQTISNCPAAAMAGFYFAELGYYFMIVTLMGATTTSKDKIEIPGIW
jgi:hypothetical protein